MKMSNKFFAALPALATAAIISFSLSSCNLFESGECIQEGDKESTVFKQTSFTPTENVAHFEETSLETEIEATPAVETVAAPAISILKAEACLEIKNHEPVSAGNEFYCTDEKVWIYSKVKMEKGSSSTIKHVYFLDGREIQSIDLKVKGPTFRTRSYKSMTESMHGSWKVEIQDEAGNLLDTVEFFVEEFEGGC